MTNALIVDDRDDIAIAVEPIKKGDIAYYIYKDGTQKQVQVLQDITIYHKFAVKEIAKGQKVTKYGEHIGEAICDIKTGEHVHVHNLQGVREDLTI